MNSLTVHFGLTSFFMQSINSIPVPQTHLFLHGGFVCYSLHGPGCHTPRLHSVPHFPEHCLPKNSCLPSPCFQASSFSAPTLQSLPGTNPTAFLVFSFRISVYSSSCSCQAQLAPGSASPAEPELSFPSLLQPQLLPSWIFLLLFPITFSRGKGCLCAGSVKEATVLVFLLICFFTDLVFLLLSLKNLYSSIFGEAF